jgi:hypothetical protein
VTVEILVPWKPGCAHRERALTWLQRRLTWPVTIAEAPAGPWCKAAAVNPAASASRADVLVVHDADVWTPGLGAAVAAVEAGAGWAVPHTGLFRLTQESTAAVLAGEEPNRHMSLDERAYRGLIGGGIIIAPRETLLAVPIDPRFTGWGQEDDSWGMALTTLAGALWRGAEPLYHLWHPPQPRDTRRYGNQAGRDLRRRYARAMHDPAAMTSLIREAKP